MVWHIYCHAQQVHRLPAFYIPKLETGEEAAYFAELFDAAEQKLANLTGAYAPVSSFSLSLLV